MKRIITNGITNLEPLAGSSEWYWGTDYASGDLHEAEDAFRSGHPIRKNRLLLVRDYDTGELLERIPGSLRKMPDGQKWLLV